MSRILSVSDLTRAVKEVLEAQFPFVWVRGQVRNLSRPASGHIYFSLTDGEASLSVVWFKSGQWRPESSSDVNPLTGEVAEGEQDMPDRIEEGMEVLCAGRINVYEPRGAYQLVAELVQEQGVGDLQLAFEELKRKLSGKGYFDEDRKMRLPANARKVAVVTSPQGAAVRDFLRLADERGWGGEIRIYPTLVQGDKAPKQIAEALRQADVDDWAEVVVLIRGGGSLEDLWAFNTEKVADAIYNMKIPVLTGIGHEPDVSIADFVADKRAATPSHAAQELWPERETLCQTVDDLDMSLTRSYLAFVQNRSERLAGLRNGLIWLSPERKVNLLVERFAGAAVRLTSAGRHFMRPKREGLSHQCRGLAHSYGPEAMETRSMLLGELGRRLCRAGEEHAESRSASLELLAARLNGLNPEGPLERGYGLIRVEKSGKFLRHPDEVNVGDSLDIRVRHGRIRAEVAKPKSGERK